MREREFFGLDGTIGFVGVHSDDFLACSQAANGKIVIGMVEATSGPFEASGENALSARKRGGLSGGW